MPTTPTLLEVFKSFDMNGDGEISYQELKAALEESAAALGPPQRKGGGKGGSPRKAAAKDARLEELMGAGGLPGLHRMTGPQVRPQSGWHSETHTSGVNDRMRELMRELKQDAEAKRLRRKARGSPKKRRGGSKSPSKGQDRHKACSCGCGGRVGRRWPQERGEGNQRRPPCCPADLAGKRSPKKGSKKRKPSGPTSIMEQYGLRDRPATGRALFDQEAEACTEGVRSFRSIF